MIIYIVNDIRHKSMRFSFFGHNFFIPQDGESR